MIAIEARNVSKTINGKNILSDISFTVKQGEICAIIGRNAAGKSMLLKCIAGFVTLTEGQITLYGKSHKEIKAEDCMLDALIEHPDFPKGFNALRNLELLASLRKKTSKEEIKLLLNNFGLDPSQKTPYKKFSLGMKQKLGIIAALMDKAKIIVLDEPTNNLDKESAKKTLSLINEYRERYGTTFVITGHDFENMEAYVDQKIMIEEGRILSIGQKVD